MSAIPFTVVQDDNVKDTVKSQSRGSAVWAELNKALAEGEMVFVPTKEDPPLKQRVQSRYSSTPKMLADLGLKTRTRSNADGVFVFTSPADASDQAAS